MSNNDTLWRPKNPTRSNNEKYIQIKERKEVDSRFVQLCAKGQIAPCKKYLAENKVNLSFQLGGHSALQLAIFANNIPLCKLLIEHNAHLHLPTSSDFASHLYRALGVNSELFNLLLDVCDTPDTAFHIFAYSIKSKKIDVANQVIQKFKHEVSIGNWNNTWKYKYTLIFGLGILFTPQNIPLFHTLVDVGYRVTYTLASELLHQRDFSALEIISHHISTFDRDELQNCVIIAMRHGFIDHMKQYHQYMLDKGYQLSISFDNITQFTSGHNLFDIPYDKLYPIITYLLPYTTNFNLIKQTTRDTHSPETVLSYLAFIGSFDTLQAIIEDTTNDTNNNTNLSPTFEPSHLVICSLFRGYYASNYYRHSLEGYEMMFDFILRDDIRPYVLGDDHTWVNKSMFVCIRYGNQRMILKLLDLGADLSNIFITESENLYGTSVIERFTLLSYACQYATEDIIQILIERGIPVNGTMIDLLDEPILQNSNTTDNTMDDNTSGENILSKKDVITDVANEDEEEDEEEEEGGEEGEEERRISKNTKKSDICFDNVKGLLFVYTQLISNSASGFVNCVTGEADIWSQGYFNGRYLNKDSRIQHCRDYYSRSQNGCRYFVNMTSLAAAIRANRVKIVELLLSCGANPNAKSMMNMLTVAALTNQSLFHSNQHPDSHHYLLQDYFLKRVKKGEIEEDTFDKSDHKSNLSLSFDYDYDINIREVDSEINNENNNNPSLDMIKDSKMKKGMILFHLLSHGLNLTPLWVDNSTIFSNYPDVALILHSQSLHHILQACDYPPQVLEYLQHNNLISTDDMEKIIDKVTISLKSTPKLQPIPTPIPTFRQPFAFKIPSTQPFVFAPTPAPTSMTFTTSFAQPFATPSTMPSNSYTHLPTYQQQQFSRRHRQSYAPHFSPLPPHPHPHLGSQDITPSHERERFWRILFSWKEHGLFFRVMRNKEIYEEISQGINPSKESEEEGDGGNAIDMDDMDDMYGLEAIISTTAINSPQFSQTTASGSIFSEFVKKNQENRLFLDILIQYNCIPTTNDFQKAGYFDFYNLDSITIPSSVTNIPPYLFYGSQVREIVFESKSQLKTIGRYAFSHCTQLTTITIPSSVTLIDKYTFSNSSLQEIIFEKESQLECISEYLFYGCKSLTKICIPTSVINLSSTSFSDSTLTNITFEPNSKLKSIPTRAFHSSHITSITIPASVEIIEANAFSNTEHLKQVTFEPNSMLHTISESVFIYSALTSIELPASLMTIKPQAFQDSRLKQITFMPDSILKTIGIAAFSYCGISSADSNPDSYSESNCTDLFIPASVTTIHDGAFRNLRNISPDFEEGSKLEIICKFAFQASTFRCLVIPSSVVEIHQGAFYEACIHYVEFEEDCKITTIDIGTFSNVANLTKIIIPKSVTVIKESAFRGCEHLHTVIFQEGSQIQKIHDFAFENCKSLKTIKFNSDIPEFSTSVFQRTRIPKATLTKMYNLQKKK